MCLVWLQLKNFVFSFYLVIHVLYFGSVSTEFVKLENFGDHGKFVVLLLPDVCVCSAIFVGHRSLSYCLLGMFLVCCVYYFFLASAFLFVVIVLLHFFLSLRSVLYETWLAFEWLLCCFLVKLAHSFVIVLILGPFLYNCAYMCHFLLLIFYFRNFTLKTLHSVASNCMNRVDVSYFGCL